MTTFGPVPRHAIAAGIAALAIVAPAQAQVFGSLANFDVVNNTGKTAYGFEIRIEDALFDHSKITSVFGYDRNFGLPGGPGAVVRYGVPTITDLPGIGVLIRYGGSFGGPSTPTGPYNTPGDSCWPFGAGWSTATSCDHFGVSTLGQPASVEYNWIVEESPGVLGTQAAGIPPVNFVYVPPAAQGGQAFVNAEIEAEAPELEHPENEGLWGEAYWVKTFVTKVDHNINIGDLFRGDDDQPDETEIETEWDIFQRAPAGEIGENQFKQHGIAIDPEVDAAIVRRYEFFEYLGPFKADGEADCKGKECNGDDHPEYVGRYLGAQMVGFNVNEDQAPIAVVPEPGTYAMMLAGLGLMGLFAQRRRR